MKIGLQIPSFKYPGGTTAIRPRLKEIAQAADAAGFYSMWVMDHFYQIKNLFGEAHTDPMLESYTTLGFLAGLTEKVRLGTMVTGVIYRHPTELIKEVTTLDVLSGGRAYFGVGAAWYESEAKGFGIPYPPTSTRFEMLEETLELAHQLWCSEGETSFTGKHTQAPAVTNNPAPISKPHPPILIGGMGPNKTMKMVAQYANACNFFESMGKERIQQSIDALKQHCEDLERDYDEIEKTSLGTVTLAEGHDTTENIIERCKKMADMGISHAIFNMTNVYEVSPIERFGTEIVPAVREL